MENKVAAFLYAIPALLLTGCLCDADYARYRDLRKRSVGEILIADTYFHDVPYFEACQITAPHGFCYIGGEVSADFSRSDVSEDNPAENVWNIHLSGLSVKGSTKRAILEDFYCKCMSAVRNQGGEFTLIAVGDELMTDDRRELAIPPLKLKDSLRFLTERLSLRMERTTSTAYITPKGAVFSPKNLCVNELGSVDSHEQWLRVLSDIRVGPFGDECRCFSDVVSLFHRAVNSALSDRGECGCGITVDTSALEMPTEGHHVLFEGRLLDVSRRLAKCMDAILFIESGVFIFADSDFEGEDGDTLSFQDETLPAAFRRILKVFAKSNDGVLYDDGLVPVLWVSEWERNRVLDFEIRPGSLLDMCRQLADAYGCGVKVDADYLIISHQ